MPTDELIETMARAYAGAPFASKQAVARMKRALSAAEAAGWVMVPKEPTEVMTRAGAQEYAMTMQRPAVAEAGARSIYAAMLAAAGEPK